MARIISRLVLLCALMAVVAPSARPAPADEKETRLRHQLTVQAALEEGIDRLQRGEYERAVVLLEKNIPHIDGNRRYLTALRDAYRGYIRKLEQSGKAGDVGLYRGRLAILEPGGRSPATPPPAKELRPVVMAPLPEEKTPPPAGGIVPRAKVDADDPFADSNSAQARRVRGLVERAETEFAAKHYEAAGRLYSQADALLPGCTSTVRERWAYCKLYCIAQTLNRGGSDAAAVEELDREVRQAVRMAPRLDGFAQTILKRLGEGGEAANVEIKHTPRQGNSWAIAETANFRIYHVLSREEGEKAARIAESTRVGMTRKWFGEEPATWTPRCDIYLHPTGQGYARATGAPPTAPGHSTISLDNGRVVSRRVDLRADDANMFAGVLPHETTHVVLAGRFGRHHVPRWADEGMAVLSEPRTRIDLHLRNLPTHRREATLFKAAELVRMADYPEPRRVGPFYAQSVSLVEFMVKKKDAATFTRFLREGLDGRYETALERYYGYRSFDELERDWQQHAFGEGNAVTASDKR